MQWWMIYYIYAVLSLWKKDVIWHNSTDRGRYSCVGLKTNQVITKLQLKCRFPPTNASQYLCMCDFSGKPFMVHGNETFNWTVAQHQLPVYLRGFALCLVIVRQIFNTAVWILNLIPMHAGLIGRIKLLKYITAGRVLKGKNPLTSNKLHLLLTAALVNGMFLC